MRHLLSGILLLLFWSAVGGSVATNAGCGGGTCIRNSDCADGFRCDRGECAVVTSQPADAAASVGDAAPAATDDATPTDSGVSDGALDSGSQTPDAS